MKNKKLLWLTYLEAKTWNNRPSSLIAIEDEYTAYCFDQAVAVFGNVVSNELESVEGKTKKSVTQKRNRILDKYLGIKPKFMDPANR